jgi:hypothetical protein
MTVEGHGGHAEPVGDAAHGELGKPLGVGDLDGCPHDAVPSQIVSGNIRTPSGCLAPAGFRHDRAHPRLRDHHTLLGQERERLGGGGQRDLPVPGELPGGGHPVARAQLAVGYAALAGYCASPLSGQGTSLALVGGVRDGAGAR